MVEATPKGDQSGSRSKKEARELAIAKAERDWNNFSNLSGKRLSMRKPGRGNRWGWELVGSDGTVHVTVTRPLFGTPLYRTDDGTYEWRRVGHAMSARKSVYELVDIATNIPILRKSGVHYLEQARTNVVLLADQLRMEFPVRPGSLNRSLGKRHQLMSAVDTSTNSLIEYRWGQSSRRRRLFFEDKGVATEIIIRPGALAIPYIEVIAAISSPWFRSYFGGGVGGG